MPDLYTADIHIGMENYGRVDPATGISGGEGLREVLARLDTREQALILGHAVPRPVVVQTRRYDTDFYNMERRK